VLWIRANDLQEEDKFFEMMQLSDWITKLEPYFVQVWVVQAWNMTYNISVKFNDPADRWRWVKAGIELLRDQGLRYNPKETLIYRELAWFFQHKMGFYLDDAHMYYKQQWIKETSRVFGMARPNWEELIHPQTDEQREKQRILEQELKMDPSIMKDLDEKYGPLEWRLPEAHAIYWASLGLKNAKHEDLITLRRAIYQSMQLSFYRGRLIPNYTTRTFALGPNLESFPNVNRTYEEQEALEEDPGQKAGIAKAQRNVIRDAIYFLYSAGREKEAKHWFDYLAEHFPNDTLLANRPDSKPKDLTVDEYAFARIQEEFGDTSPDRTKGVVEGLLRRYYLSLALDEDDAAANYDLLIRKAYARYATSTKGQEVRMGLAPLDAMKKEVREQLLDPERGLIPEYRAVLLTKLGLPAETNAPPVIRPSTNSMDFELRSANSATNPPAGGR
jgi:hypothetical protein